MFLLLPEQVSLVKLGYQDCKVIQEVLEVLVLPERLDNKVSKVERAFQVLLDSQGNKVLLVKQEQQVVRA